VNRNSEKKKTKNSVTTTRSQSTSAREAHPSDGNEPKRGGKRHANGGGMNAGLRLAPSEAQGPAWYR
jgi:hypothetical protein